MAITEALIHYRRWLKRRNHSACTIRDYMSTLKGFVLWLDTPIEDATCKNILSFIDHLLDKRLTPKTINCYLDSIRSFYNYLINEEDVSMSHPVKRGYVLRLSRPLPRYLRDEEVPRLFEVINNLRDRAIFMLMLRCGLRVAEVAGLSLAALDLPRSQLFVYEGKGLKDRVVYLSHDAQEALSAYLKVRPSSKAKRLFLVGKGRCAGSAMSVRAIQKRMEFYAREAGLKVSCHQLRHTMATQLLNADADLVTIQDLLGHSRIKTTQRYLGKVTDTEAIRWIDNLYSVRTKRVRPREPHPSFDEVTILSSTFRPSNRQLADDIRRHSCCRRGLRLS